MWIIIWRPWSKLKFITGGISRPVWYQSLSFKWSRHEENKWIQQVWDNRYWLNLPHGWFCKLGCSKSTKANQNWKLFSVSFPLFSWVRSLKIGKCHLLICWGGKSWRKIFWTLMTHTMPKAQQRAMGWYVLPINNNIPVTIFYQHQHQGWMCWGVTCQRASEYPW